MEIIQTRFQNDSFAAPPLGRKMKPEELYVH